VCVGETRVDLEHLLEDLRDAYTGSLEETILTEVIANALDSGATRVRLLTDAVAATLTIIDDGRGCSGESFPVAPDRTARCCR
jgi:hypothetical protein